MTGKGEGGGKSEPDERSGMEGNRDQEQREGEKGKVGGQ